MKKRKSEPKKSSNPVQKQAKTAYFSEQLQAIWQICPDLGTFEDFSKLAGTTPSTISKIVSGKSKTKATRVIGRFLPVFIAYGAVTTAEDARRLIEPPFHPIKKGSLQTICNNILERRYPFLISLSKADRDNVNNFASTIDKSYSTHPDPYTLDEVTEKPELKSNLELMNYYTELAYRHQPDAEKLLFEAYRKTNKKGLRSHIISCLVLSGCDEAIRELPKLIGNEPSMSYWRMLHEMPVEAFHRAKRAWLELVNYPSPDWREIASNVIAQDPDQCEIKHVIEMAFTEKNKRVRENAVFLLRSEIKGLSSTDGLISFLSHLKEEIYNRNSPIAEWNSPLTDWEFPLLEESLKEITSDGGHIPPYIRELVAELILSILKTNPLPNPSVLRCLAFPDFQIYRWEFIEYFSEQMILLANSEDTKYITMTAIDTLSTLGAPNIKEYLLKIHRTSTNPSMQDWAMETLRTRTDMQFSFYQRLRHKLLPSIYH